MVAADWGCALVLLVLPPSTLALSGEDGVNCSYELQR
jgi:hypothetical protein